MDDDNGYLTLAHASAIIDIGLAKAKEAALEAITIIVLDAGGHVIACKRQDGAGILRFEVAFGKAWGALGMGRPSRHFEQVAMRKPHFVNALAVASSGRLIPVGGGVLIRNEEGRILGAVGVSGDTADNDEFCAIEGISAVGLKADPSEITNQTA